MIRVLIVEDNERVCQMMRDVLMEQKDHLFEVEICADINHALQKLKSTTFDAVLLDLALPDSHGVETVKRVREAFPKIPITAMTGLDDEETATYALRAGAQDYLVKGDFNSKVLVKSIRYGIERLKGMHS